MTKSERRLGVSGVTELECGSRRETQKRPWGSVGDYQESVRSTEGKGKWITASFTGKYNEI